MSKTPFQNSFQQEEGFEKASFRRRYPRRRFRRMIGILLHGVFSTTYSGEVGEGGMSLEADIQLPEGAELVLSFQIPNGDFVSLRAEVRSTREAEGKLYTGVSFVEIPFTNKRQIRAYVSSRSEKEKLIIST